MTFPDLKFLDGGVQASLADLDQLEKRLGLPLPGALRSWLGLHSGAMLDDKNNWISMDEINGLPSSVGVQYMLSVDGIDEILQLLNRAFPPLVIPFADDGDGNCLLMAPDGSIYFWDWHARINAASPDAMDDCTLKVADSLPAFLSKLGPGPLSEDSE